MANANNPHGLRPLGVTVGGGVPQIEHFKKLVGYGSAIYRNDAVARAADAAIQLPATPGTTLITGVAMAYSAASTADTVAVMITPEAIYEAQVNGSLVEADLGLNANLLYTAGNSTTKMSKHEINAASADVTSTLDVHLLKLHPVPRNAFGTNAKFEIVINKSRLANAVVGV